MSPVHVLSTPGEVTYTKGAENVKRFNGNGRLTFDKATCCGCSLNQGPEGAPFRAYYPRMIKSYVDGKKNTYPADLMPTGHVNYENRQMDWADDLPKW